MLIYENKRNNDKVQVESSSLKFGEVEVTYISSAKHQVGDTQFIKIGTFKRWWNLVEEVQEEADNDIKEDIIDAEIELNVNMENLVPMPGIEKLEVLKKEYSRKEKIDIFDYIVDSVNLDYKLSADGRRLYIKAKNFNFTIDKRKNKIRIFISNKINIATLNNMIYDVVEKHSKYYFYVDKDNILAVLNILLKI